MTDRLVNLTEEEDTQKGRYLIFSIDNESYGIGIQYVTEIIGIQKITEVSGLPDYMKGIINLRGRIIPVMDVRLRFRKEAREYNDRTCIIVIDTMDMSVGLIVDGVSEVASINETDISELPQMRQKSRNGFVKNIGKIGSDVRLLLDCEKLLTEEDIGTLNEIVSG